MGELSDSGKKDEQKWGVGSLSPVFSILGTLVGTIQTKSLSLLETNFQAFSSVKSLLGIGLIILSYMLAKNYPNHKFSAVGKKSLFFYFMLLYLL